MILLSAFIAGSSPCSCRKLTLLFFFFKEGINRKQLSKAATESFELVPSWVPVCPFQKPYSGRNTACMKEPRASHFWSQELKDHIINSGWLSVCWSSLPEGLNILPDRLWWLLYMLFIMLQFGTHKACYLKLTLNSCRAEFSQHNCSWTVQRGWAVLGPCFNPYHSLLLFGVVTADWSCRVQGVHVHAVKVKIIFLFSACLAILAVDLDGPSPPLFNTGCFESGQLDPPGLFILLQGSGHDLLLWNGWGLGMCEFLSVSLARIIASKVLRSQQDLWSLPGPL